MKIMLYSLGALLTGFALDMLLGDPYFFPHIVRGMGSLISALEKLLRRLLPATAQGEKNAGILMVITVILVCTGIPVILLVLCYYINYTLGYILESFICWQLLAAKSLKTESMKVYNCLAGNDIEYARKSVSMIVGRDTAMLDKDGIIRAAVETVAENTSDGITAPVLFIMLGSVPLGCMYKAVNTMDSMVGYKNDKYINFGYAAAKTDDLLNYVPSRICALLMIAASFLLRLDAKNAFYIWKRDRRSHASPNSAQTEAACAGALGVRLAGPIAYFGKMQDKPYIGDDSRPICAEDIKGANRLMNITSILTLALAVLFRIICLGVFYAAV